MDRKLGIAVLALLALGACTSRGGLHDTRIKSGEGPDPFKITTQKPIVHPKTYEKLPEPGGEGNRADIDPRQDAASAMGGNIRSNGIPKADGALVRHAGRYGQEPGIRGELDAADEKFRKRRGGLAVRKSGRYYRVYAPMSLDAQSEMDRFRKAGVTVPTAPPE